MDKFILAASTVTEADLASARLGNRFGRLDLASQLSLLAVESLNLNFDAWPRERIAIVLTARAGSLSTDVDYWNGREAAGGPSPTLFAYTLPSAAIGEIAIRHRITGPNLCFVGPSDGAVDEAAELLSRGEADACLCISNNVVTPALGALIGAPSAACASALFLAPNGPGLPLAGQIRRDIESLCLIFQSGKTAT